MARFQTRSPEERATLAVAALTLDEKIGLLHGPMALDASAPPAAILIGFQRVELEPGESRILTVHADRRLLVAFDEHRRQWDLPAGMYAVRMGRSAADLLAGGEARIAAFRGPLGLADVDSK